MSRSGLPGGGEEAQPGGGRAAQPGGREEAQPGGGRAAQPGGGEHAGRVRELERPPALARLYARALLPHRRGERAWPGEALVLPGVRVDRAHLAAYARACGFVLRDRLPPTYPHVLAFPLAVELMSRPSFPLPLAGLVHVRNEVVQRRAIDAGEQLTLRVRLTRLRPHRRGRQFDAVAEAEAAGETVWRATSTYLRRERTGDGPGDGRGEAPGGAPAAIWRVGPGVARRYARVSGDRNPIHLSALAARLFGLPGIVAHGMWTKARCLAALDPRLPEALRVAVTFHKPVVLPATVQLVTAAGGTTFAVQAAGADRLHLRGAVEALGSRP